MKNLTDFHKMVETGVDLHLYDLCVTNSKKKIYTVKV